MIIKKNPHNHSVSISVLLILLIPWYSPVFALQNTEQEEKVVYRMLKENIQPIDNNTYTIKKIIVQGNKHIKEAPILSSIPFKVGNLFDGSLSSVAINNLYSMGHFAQITLSAELIDDKNMTLYVKVEEKKLLETLKIKGNKAVRTSKIREQLNLAQITTIDAEVLHRISLGIQKMYAEECRYFIDVATELIPNQDNPDKLTAIITIDEGPQSRIVHVNFSGNASFDDRKLRSFLFTRENWLLSFTDGAGTLHEGNLEMDKHRIEYFYRDNGYLMVKVPKADVIYSDNKKNIDIQFYVQEGQKFTIRSISFAGDNILGDVDLMPYVAIREGQIFSQSLLVKSIQRLKDLWGEKGYIYADINPQTKLDEETQEVDIIFHLERGSKLYANRVLVTGNRVTKDKIIRRQLGIVEGDLITTKDLEESKKAVEYLSFFERDGVDWKIHRVSDELADLEINVTEAKTGNFNFQLTYGSDRYSPKPSLKGMITLEKTNLCGNGWDVGALIQGSRNRLPQRLEAHFFDPYLFDSNVSFFTGVFKRWTEYESWKTLSKTPIQIMTGGDVKFGFGLPSIDKRLRLFVDVGLEDIKNKDVAKGNFVADRRLHEGTLFWIGLELIKDTRNHQVYPNQGYKVCLSSKLASPFMNREFGFIKNELQMSWYNALIGVDSLVLAMQLKIGYVERFGKDRVIPYKELFHMGGQTTVRGHVWGGIGPALMGDPLGGKNAVQFNTELIFPLIPDYSMKGHLFYDAGSGWNTPKNDIPADQLCNIRRDNFDVRHTVGFGLNLLKPMPAKVDWGFKLDRRKDQGESAHEFHLHMNYAW